MRKPGLLLLLLGLPPACATTTQPPIVTLHPDMPDVRWQGGLAAIVRERSDHRLAVAFDHLNDYGIAMRVEVLNTGRTPLEVDPSLMAWVECSTPTVCSSQNPLVDRDRTRDQAIGRELDAIGSNSAVSLGLLFLDTVAAVNSVATGDPLHHDQSSARELPLLNADTDERRARIAALEASRADWSSVSLQRTILLPGQALSGPVYLPVREKAKLMWLCVRVGQVDSWFRFNQEVLTGP